MLSKLTRFMPASPKLTKHQADVLDKLDSWLVENTPDYRGGMKLVALEVPLVMQMFSADKIVAGLTKELRLAGYMPRGLSMITLVDGSWLIVIAERSETQPETDMVKLQLFYYLMNQTNSARENL